MYFRIKRRLLDIIVGVEAYGDQAFPGRERQRSLKEFESRIEAINAVIVMIAHDELNRQ